jgi:hypothetical protein
MNVPKKWRKRMSEGQLRYLFGPLAELAETEYEGHKFYLRRFKKRFEQRVPSPGHHSSFGATGGKGRDEKK